MSDSVDFELKSLRSIKKVHEFHRGEAFGDRLAELIEKREELNDTDFETVKSQLVSLNVSRHALDKNHEDLVESLERLERADEGVFQQGGLEELAMIANEVSRQLLNYIGAIYAVKEHVCNTILPEIESTVCESPTKSDYEAKVSEFGVDIDGPMILGLRNIAIHEGLPSLVAQSKGETVEDGSLARSRAMSLSKEELEENDKLSSAGKGYVGSFEGDYIPIGEVIEYTQESLTILYDWLEEEIRECANTTEEDARPLAEECYEIESELFD